MLTSRRSELRCRVAFVPAVFLLASGMAGADPGGGTAIERSRIQAAEAAAGDRFGEAVALRGTTCLVGAPGSDAAGVDAGAAYVLEEQGASWVQVQRLTASAPAPGDLFGSGVALAEDTLVVSAPATGTAGAGAAYVYERSGSSFVETQVLLAPDPAPGNAFGHAVAIDGDTILVGSPFDDAPLAAEDSGSAYVFVRSGTSWSFQRKLRIEAPAYQIAGNQLGWSVALVGDRAFVGYPGQHGGDVRVFERSAGVWEEGGRVNPDGGDYSRFGSAVAADGDRVLVGGPGNWIPGGLAAVHLYDGTLWLEEDRLFPADAAQDDEFGCSVALDGDRALIGARGQGAGGSGSGAVYLFERRGAIWRQSARLGTSDTAPGDGLFAVALDGDRGLAGAPGHDAGGADTGQVYGLALGEVVATAEPDVEVLLDDACVCALDGDGEHLIIGSPGWCYTGLALIYVRTPSGWELEQRMEDTGATGAGAAVAIDGDTAIVGAPLGSEGSCFVPGDRGEARFYERQGSSWVLVQTVVDHAYGGKFASSVGLDGDVAVVGEPEASSIEGGNQHGRGIILVRNGTQWTAQIAVQGSDTGAGDRFGSGAAVDGDVAVFGAPTDDPWGAESGSAYVFERAGPTWVETAKLTAGDGAPFTRFGQTIAISGDTIAVAASGVSDGPDNEGAVYVYRRSGTSWPQEAKLVAFDARVNDFFGQKLALVGDRLATTARGNQSVYVFERGGTSWVLARKLLPPGPTLAMTLLGDQVVVGARLYPVPFTIVDALEVFEPAGSFPAFCDASDGALDACPCGDVGLPGSGCDLPQGTGGVRLGLLARATSPTNRATFLGTGFPPATAPSATLIRSPDLEPAGAVVFGDGLRCIGLPLVRVGAGIALGGSATIEAGHGAMAGAGTFFYQLHLRSTPVMYCDPAAAFNLSSGRAVTWP